MLRFSIVILLLLLCPEVRAQKTSRSEPRLVKELRRAYNSLGYFSRQDSAVYTYSADRAWDTVKNDWKYDVRTDGNARIVRTFDGQNRIAIENYQQFDRGFWWPDKRMLFDYQNNKVANMTYQEWVSGAWQNLVRYDYSYDGAGNKIVDITMVWEPSGWQNSTRLVTTYSGNNAVEILHEKWVQNAWQPVAGEYFVYSNGKKAERQYKLASAGWSVILHDIFFYNSKGNDSMTLTRSADNNNSFDTIRYTFHYNKNNKQDTVILQKLVNGADSNISKTLMLYDAFGLLGLKNTRYWNDTKKEWYYPVGVIEQLYEYDHVNVGIKGETERDRIFELYPVPAKGSYLNARFETDETQPVQVMIYSVDGKLAGLQTRAAAWGNNNIRINIADLVSGNYMLIISSGTERMSRFFTVER